MRRVSNIWPRPDCRIGNSPEIVYFPDMKKLLTIAYIGTGLLLHAGAFAQVPAEKYSIDSVSVEHAGVPKGELIKCSFDHSSVFPGTRRDYWIYIPAQYRPDHPACVYVNQDGIQWKAPVVF